MLVVPGHAQCIDFHSSQPFPHAEADRIYISLLFHPTLVWTLTFIQAQRAQIATIESSLTRRVFKSKDWLIRLDVCISKSDSAIASNRTECFAGKTDAGPVWCCVDECVFVCCQLLVFCCCDNDSSCRSIANMWNRKLDKGIQVSTEQSNTPPNWAPITAAVKLTIDNPIIAAVSYQYIHFIFAIWSAMQRLLIKESTIGFVLWAPQCVRALIQRQRDSQSNWKSMAFKWLVIFVCCRCWYFILIVVVVVVVVVMMFSCQI